jgi:hypothetical protein
MAVTGSPPEPARRARRPSAFAAALLVAGMAHLALLVGFLIDAGSDRAAAGRATAGSDEPLRPLPAPANELTPPSQGDRLDGELWDGWSRDGASADGAEPSLVPIEAAGEGESEARDEPEPGADAEAADGDAPAPEIGETPRPRKRWRRRARRANEFDFGI